MDEACLPALNLGNPAGSVCAQSTDCDGGAELRCVIKPGQSQGVCAVPVEVGGGEKCAGVDQVCVATQYCGTDGFCRVKPGVNEPCDAAIPCSDGLKCAGATETLCSAKASNGATCSSGDDCTGGFCVQTSGSGSFGTCSSKLSIDFSSEACEDFRPAN
jgi:hypothetical protein